METSSSPVLRLRITFAKTAAMRYSGHLDLHRTWERTFRRAGLPLAYSQGFNPHPRLNLASALPLGFTSQEEVLDAWLEQDLPLSEVQAALENALPPGLRLVQIEREDLGATALQTELKASDYLVTFIEPIPELETRAQEVLATQKLVRLRRKKEYDLRPLILGLEVLPVDEQGNPRLSMRLKACEGATGRPDEVLEAMGADPLCARIERKRLHFDRD